MSISRTVFGGKSLWLAVAALVAAFAAVLFVLPQQASAADTGRVRVMHASPDTPAVDIFVDGAKAVTALAFPNNTPYVTLPAGGHNVKVFVSPSDGTGAPALEATLDIGTGKDYSVLAVGELEQRLPRALCTGRQQLHTCGRQSAYSPDSRCP